MFSTTFLGHQGWMFQSAQSCVLVDPLLCEEFGHAHVLEYRVYPPRVFKTELFPRVDAVILTHEHDDHFDIPSLSRLDRRIPIFLSARSSAAGYGILCEMGFEVYPLVPGVGIQIHDLEVLPLCGDHVNTNTEDEWDTLPFLVRHMKGAGSFFSTVDVALTPAHIELVKTRVRKPGLLGWTNNAQDWSHVATYMPSRGDATESATQRMRAGHSMVSSSWGAPAAMLICAGGFSFSGSRAWLNQRVFCVDTDRVAKAMGAQHSQNRFFAPRPGQTFHMDDNRMKKVDDQTPFLFTEPQESWPSRARAPLASLPDYEPATGRRDLTSEDMGFLHQRLTEFAEALVGSMLFKGLYSLLGIETDGRMSTFAFVLRHGAEQPPLVFEYNPNACTFDPGSEENPREAYLAGMECWATDLLAVLSGELGPIGLSFGRSFLWNALPERFIFSLIAELNRVSHPLRRPAEYLRIYQRLLKQAGSAAPTILSRDAG